DLLVERELARARADQRGQRIVAGERAVDRRRAGLAFERRLVLLYRRDVAVALGVERRRVGRRREDRAHGLEHLRTGGAGECGRREQGGGNRVAHFGIV